MFQTRASGVKGRDTHVWPVAKDIVQRSQELGVTVDAVRLLMARAYVDANREMDSEPNLTPDTIGQTALEDPLLISVYQTYHSELRRLVERSIQSFGDERILFIDLHGFGRQPKIAPPRGYDLILGTANRKTIRHGEVDRAFAKFMEELDYCVFLPGEHPVSQHGDPYSAGYTTCWYAEHYGINVIQLEVSSSFRKKENQSQGEKLTVDIAEFLSRFYR